MNIAIAGFDTEGHSSYNYFSAQDHRLTVLDQNPDLVVPIGVDSVLGPNYLHNLDRFDLIVRTAGLRPQLIFTANPDLNPAKVTTQINEFFKVCPTKNTIGITGTKGKGTTSTLITKMLQAAGYNVQLAGNIGLPVLEILPQLTADSWVVLELSSYQLSDCRYSPHIAACLMIEPEHLDWHQTFAAYKLAKQQLVSHQTNDDVTIFYEQNETSKEIADASTGQHIPYMKAPGANVKEAVITINNQVICSVSELRMIGQHNWQNACAATTVVWQIIQDIAAIRSVLTSFSGLPFRIEQRREIDGVTYYNDSFASGGGATVAAIRAIAAPKVMIIGGYDRQLDLVNFARVIAEAAPTIRKVLLIGQSGKRMAKNLDAAGFINYLLSDATTMPAIVAAARALALPGDAVVLSPGFASFDMFKNFEDRGNQFNEAVAKL